MATSIFDTALILFNLLVTASLFGWGTELVYNKFVPKFFPNAPMIDWIDGFAIYTVLGLLAAAPRLLG